MIGASAHATNLKRERAVLGYLNQHFQVSFITDKYDLGDVMMDNALDLRDAYKRAGYEVSLWNLQRAFEACKSTYIHTTLDCIEGQLP
jgi:hypothetical protein